MTIYIHWPQDISLAALQHVELAISEYRQRHPQQYPVELENVENEARAIIQKASIGAIKVERRSDPPEDELLA